MATFIYTKEFEAWWAKYPLKVGKLAAEKAYLKARRRASEYELLDGVARYVQWKPDWMSWANPQTWLNQGRWFDDYAKPAPVTKPVPAYLRPYVPLRLRANGD